MLAEERLEKIWTRLKVKGTLVVDDVASEMSVSSDTIRRDFNRLAARVGVRRTHGGLMFATDAKDSTLAEREVRASAEKRAIARTAASHVADDETIVVDAGSTAVLLVDHITARNVTVITYSVEVAARAMRNENLSVYMAGGMVRRSTGAAVGDDTIRMIRSLQASTAFMGANGFGVDVGLATPNYLEAAVKRALIEISRRRILLADASKLGRRALARFGDLTDIDLIITDQRLGREHAEELRSHCGSVQVVPVDPVDDGGAT